DRDQSFAGALRPTETGASKPTRIKMEPTLADEVPEVAKPTQAQQAVDEPAGDVKMEPTYEDEGAAPACEDDVAEPVQAQQEADQPDVAEPVQVVDEYGISRGWGPPGPEWASAFTKPK
ncbi:MAG: hypothetical protein CBB71_01575, partial [Rhodopirellula sp. TMED11]